VFGTLLATHPKASELANRLLGFKDLCLVGFFLSIGLSGTPTWTAFGIALLLVLAVPFKAALFFAILTRFKLRARTAILSALSLTNYSEFGLIVASIGVANSWIGKDWLIVIAISLSITFVLAAGLAAFAHNIYARFSDLLKQFETSTRLKEDEPIHTGEAGIDAAYSLYEEAGVGFVDHVCSELGYCRLRQKRAKS
jgi:glutathione-regulated potassium-efflux system ancillary protein KefC